MVTEAAVKTKDVLVIGGVGLLAYYLLAGGKTRAKVISLAAAVTGAGASCRT